MARGRDSTFSPGLIALVAVFCLIFVAGGSTLLWMGFSQRRLAKESVNWPRVPGRVLHFAIGPDPTKGLPEVQMLYAYLVRGREHRSQRILFGSHDASDIERWRQQHAAGNDLDVYLHPVDPNLAVLEPGRVYGSWIIILFGALLALTGALIARGFIKAWRSTRRRRL